MQALSRLYPPSTSHSINGKHTLFRLKLHSYIPLQRHLTGSLVVPCPRIVQLVVCPDGLDMNEIDLRALLLGGGGPVAALYAGLPGLVVDGDQPVPLLHGQRDRRRDAQAHVLHLMKAGRDASEVVFCQLTLRVVSG